MATPRILLADDFLDAAEMYADFLRFHGYDVVIVGDGRTALEAARAETFDIVILDLRMPEMSGLDVVRALKAEGAAYPAPVIALTAHAFPSEQQEAMRAGFDAVLAKPALPQQVLATVQSLIPIVRGDAGRTGAGGGSGRPPLGK